MAGRRAARDRIVRALWSAGSTTLRAFARILHVLFLEVTGFLFIALTVGFGGVAVREYHKYKLGAAPAYKVALAACFAVMFLWFGVTSFWRARRRRA
jgi:hypothetical protein